MTSEQLSLSVGLSRSTDALTSKSAAKAITGRTERRLLAWFENAHAGGRYSAGWTDDELTNAIPDIFPPTLKSARSRLSNKGLLVDSGERRASQRGQQMIVWKLSTERVES